MGSGFDPPGWYLGKQTRISKPKRSKGSGRSLETAPPQFPMRDRRVRRPADQLRKSLQRELDEIDQALEEK